jgi:hypothetical protein
MLKTIALLAGLALSATAAAQTTITPAAQQVQLLAPQLVAFSGSTGNFDSLVNGLTSGAPVTLTTLSPDGFIQIVTFLPSTTLSPLDAARQLEAARQNLIVRGVATPSAQQLAAALVGGALPTPAGNTTITGVLGGTTPVQVRNELAPVAPGVGTAGASALNLSASSLQALRSSLAQGSPVTLTSTTATGASQNVTFTAPGGPMNAFEVNQTLQLASALLAQQGIVNPTADQVRVALVGGTLTGINGANVPVRGVLQGRVRNTSESPVVNTSASPFFGTSDTPPSQVPVQTGAPTLGVGPTVAPAAIDGVRRANTAEGAARARPITRPGG